MASPSEAAAIKYEQRAKEYARRARVLEGLRKKPRAYGEKINVPSYHEKIEELHRQASMLYEQAAKEWNKTKKRNEALEDYEQSLEFAWRPGDKDRLQEIIDELYQSKKPKGLLSFLTKPKSLFSVLSIAFLLGSLFFVSFSLTGNAIASLSSDNLTLAGTGMFILGLVFLFFYVKEKKRGH